jgi:hypothetical protein
VREQQLHLFRQNFRCGPGGIYQAAKVSRWFLHSYDAAVLNNATSNDFSTNSYVLFMISYTPVTTVRSESRCALRLQDVDLVYRDRPRTLNELKTAITAFIRNISQADLQKVFCE